MRDLNVSGGGAIRISSLINILKSERQVKVYSKTSHLKGVDNNSIGIKFTANEKRVFQLLLAFFPIFIASFIFRGKLRRIEDLFKKNVSEESDIVFCEYLDTSVGYYLYKKGLINNYINDIHGISTLELKYKDFGSGFLKNIALFMLCIYPLR